MRRLLQRLRDWLFGVTPFIPPSVVVSDEEPAPDREKRTLALEAHNDERDASGIPRLRLDRGLQEEAQSPAEIIARGSWEGPVHARMSTRLRNAGFRNGGENYFSDHGFQNGIQVTHRWMLSPGHANNIMEPSWTHVGFGFKMVDGVSYWIALYGAEGVSLELPVVP